ncbi:MAG: pantothenate kinase [Cyanobacteria bacterium J06621_8]
MKQERHWLALMIGNSRLHWGWFNHHSLIEAWDTPHLDHHVESSHLPEPFLRPQLINQGLTFLPVYLASVVSAQARLWKDYHQLNLLNLNEINLANIYPTMGLDRALAAWAALAIYQQPCLVIDGGTALTLTGVDRAGKLMGGAILPGLGGQIMNLKQKTAALPQIQLPQSLPPRWALNTEQAIASGIIYTAIAGIQSFILDWWQQFPKSPVILTGGDAELLAHYLHLQFSELKLMVEPHLILQGIRLAYQQRQQ